MSDKITPYAVTHVVEAVRSGVHDGRLTNLERKRIFEAAQSQSGKEMDPEAVSALELLAGEMTRLAARARHAHDQEALPVVEKSAFPIAGKDIGDPFVHVASYVVRDRKSLKSSEATTIRGAAATPDGGRDVLVAVHRHDVRPTNEHSHYVISINECGVVSELKAVRVRLAAEPWNAARFWPVPKDSTDF